MAEEPEDTLPPEGAEAEALPPEQVDGGTPEGGDDPPETAVSPDVEELAREMGWSTQDKWRGNPSDWKDAKTFLKTTVEINRTQSRELRELKGTVDRMARTTAAIADRHIREERERLEQRFTEATEAGDADAAWRAAQELQRVDATPAATDPLADFKARNPWFEADPEARAYAHSIGEIHKGKDAAEVMRLAEEAVRKRFPEHFEGQTPARQPARTAPLVNAPATRSARPAPRAKSAADLPTEARKAGEDFVRRGRVKDLAEYAKIYFEENA